MGRSSKEMLATFVNGCLSILTAILLICVALSLLPPLFADYHLAHLWAVTATVALLPFFLAMVWWGLKRMWPPLDKPYDDTSYVASHHPRRSLNERIFLFLCGSWVGGPFLCLIVTTLLRHSDSLSPSSLRWWASGATLALGLLGFMGYRFGQERMEGLRKGSLLLLGFLFLLFGVAVPLARDWSSAEVAGLLFGLLPTSLFCYAMALSWDPARLGPFRTQTMTQGCIPGLLMLLAVLLILTAILFGFQLALLRLEEFINASLLSGMDLFLGYTIVQLWRYRPRYDMGQVRELVAWFADPNTPPKKMRMLLEEYPELLGHEADRTLEDMIQNRRRHTGELERKRRLLARCRKVGIAQAFEETEQG